MAILVNYLKLTTVPSVPTEELRIRFPVPLELSWRNLVFNFDEDHIHTALNSEIYSHCLQQLATDVSENETNIESVDAFHPDEWAESGGYHSATVNVKVMLVTPPATFKNWTFSYDASPVQMKATARWKVL